MARVQVQNEFLPFLLKFVRAYKEFIPEKYFLDEQQMIDDEFSMCWR